MTHAPRLARSALPLLLLAWIGATGPATQARTMPPALPQTRSGIPLDQPWKSRLYGFAVSNVRHPSWGLAHSERNYQNAIALASSERLAVDSDVLFAAAFLHDLGGLKGFSKDGVDHAVRSAELAPGLLRSFGFPEAKLPAVQETILAHVYYGAAAPRSAEAKAFHDADLLDFLGDLGIARIFGAAFELSRTDSLAEPAAVLGDLARKLPERMATQAARERAGPKAQQALDFLKRLDADSFGGKAL